MTESNSELSVCDSVTVQSVSPGPVLSGLSDVSVLEQVSSPCELKTNTTLEKRKHPKFRNSNLKQFKHITTRSKLFFLDRCLVLKVDMNIFISSFWCIQLLCSHSAEKRKLSKCKMMLN